MRPACAVVLVDHAADGADVRSKCRPGRGAVAASGYPRGRQCCECRWTALPTIRADENGAIVEREIEF